jgi:DNA-binding SARP family transcriptional activator
MRYGILGPLEVLAPDGTEVDLGGPRQASVLAALLVDAGRVVPLDSLIDRVWGEDSPPTAAATIQGYVSNLRKALEPAKAPRAPSSLIVSKASGYSLQVEQSAIDAGRFEDLLSQGRALTDSDPRSAADLLAEALALWRGPALSDFRYAQFAQAEIARLEELRLVAIESSADARLVLGEHAELVPELERLVAEHPLRERFWGQLMVALYRSGRQAEALRACARLRTTLGEELGLGPSPELVRLEEAILTHDPAVAAPAATPSVPAIAPSPGRPAPLSEPGIVGRRAEMARLGEAIERAKRGAGSFLLIEGEAGIGKSHLLAAMLRAAGDEGLVVTSGNCFEGGGAPPYWPWAQAVRGVADRIGPDRLVGLAGAHAPTLGVLVPELGLDEPATVNPLAMANATLQLVRAITATQPMVVAFDDLYGADPDSVTMMTVLAEAAGSIPLVAIGTYRRADVADDHPLTDMLARVSRFDHVERIPLARLQPEEVASLVARVTGDTVDPAVSAEIHRRTGGNALFTVELARLLRSEGSLDDPTGAALPPGIRDVIRRRLSRLSPETKTLLGVAAVAGRDFDLDVVAEVAGLDADASLDAVDLAIVSQLIEETGHPPRLRFTHVLVQQALEESLTALRRARLHHRIAEAMEHHQGGFPRSWAAIAHHATEAVPVTGPEAALPAVQRAAQHASSSGASALALELWEANLDLVLAMPPSPSRDRAELDAHRMLSQAVTMSAGWANTRLGQIGSRLVDFGASGGELGFVLDGRMAILGHFLVTGRFEDARHVASQIDELANSTGDPMASLCGHMGAGIACHYLGRIQEAEDRWLAGELLLEVVDPGATGKVLLPPGQQGALSSFWSHRAQSTWMTGRVEAALEQSTAALAVATREETGGFGHSFACIFNASLHFKNDDPLSTIKVAGPAVNEAQEAGFVENAAFLRVLELWARVRLGEGSFDELRAATEAVTSRASVEALHEWAMVSDGALTLDRPLDALEAIERGRLASETTGARMWLPELERLRADALLRLGRRDEASASIDTAERLANEIGAVPLLQRARAWRDQQGLRHTPGSVA